MLTAQQSQLCGGHSVSCTVGTGLAPEHPLHQSPHNLGCTKTGGRRLGLPPAQIHLSPPPPIVREPEDPPQRVRGTQHPASQPKGLAQHQHGNWLEQGASEASCVRGEDPKDRARGQGDRELGAEQSV